MAATERGRSTEDEYVGRLKETLEELRSAFPAIVAELGETIAKAFGFTGPVKEWRPRLCASSQQALFAITDPALRVLCLRLADKEAPEASWITAIGAQVTGRPVVKWEDGDFHHFVAEMPRWAAQFRRVEAASSVASVSGVLNAARISVTFPDGRDMQQVVASSADEASQVDIFVNELRPFLKSRGNVGTVALARLLWEQLAGGTLPASK